MIERTIELRTPEISYSVENNTRYISMNRRVVLKTMNTVRNYNDVNDIAQIFYTTAQNK